MANLKDRFNTAEQRQEEQYQSNTAKRETMLADPNVSDTEKEQLRYSQAIDDAIRGKTKAESQGITFFSGGTGSGKQSDASRNILSIIKQYDDSLPSDKSSKYMTTVDRMLAQIAGDKFSYDAKSDPRYALAEEYAQKAMENQMAESALLTGGYGNSYAAASGQQVYTDYMNDAVNDMEDRAYQKWAAERDNAYNLLGLAQGLEEQAYNRAQTEKQWQYQTEQDAKADAEMAKANAQQTVKAYIEQFGTTDGLTAEEIAATGWSQSYIAALIEGTKKERAGETNAATDETIAKNDALIGEYLQMGVSVPADLIANSSYAGREDLLAGYQAYYKGLRTKSTGDTAYDVDKRVMEYLEMGLVPPAELVASSSYAGQDDLLAGYLSHYQNENDGGDGDGNVLNANDTKNELVNLAQDILGGSQGIGKIPKVAALLREAMSAKGYTVNGTNGMKTIIDTMRSSGIINDYGKAMLYKALNISEG